MIKFSRGLLNPLTVTPVSESIHDGHAHLTKYTGRKISRPLRGETNGEAILSPLLGNRVKGVQPCVGELVTDSDIKNW